MAKGWGYQIDYERAIADDRRQIASLEGLAARGLLGVAPDEYLWARAIADDAVAATFALTLADRKALAYWLNYRPEELPAAIEAADLPPRWGARAVAIETALTAVWPNSSTLPTADEHRRALRKAKADLARHLRNQATYR